MTSASSQENDPWIASQRNIRGEIDVEELAEIERSQSQRITNALLNLSKENVKQEFFSKILEVLHMRKAQV